MSIDIALNRLQETWRGLSLLMHAYQFNSDEWNALCEARRLVEVELNERGYTGVVIDLQDE